MHAGRLCPDETVVDWRVPAVVKDGVEEACIGVLVYRDLFASDGGGEWFRCHGFSLFPFVWRDWVEEFPDESLAVLSEGPSPAWAIMSAGAVLVDAVDVSCPFEFNHAAPQALRRVATFHRFGHVGQSFLGDWFPRHVEECEHVELWGVVH